MHQGAPFSMLLFLIFMNPLIEEIRKKRLGAYIGDICVSCPIFADDMQLVTLSRDSLQQLVNVSENYSSKWRFKFSPTKCILMCFGCNVNDGKTVSLGGTEIPRVEKTKHLGSCLATKPGMDVEYFEDKITKGRKCIFGLMGIGNKNSPVSPLTVGKVYETVSIPTMLYGVEVCHISAKAMKLLESAHWAIAKHIQGLYSQTPNVAVLPGLGWTHIDGVIDRLRLTFYGGLCRLDASNIYKQVARLRFIQCKYDQRTGMSTSPTSIIVKTLRKYKLYQKVEGCMTGGELMSKWEWKNTTKTVVYKVDKQRWNATCQMYSKLDVYKEIVKDNQPWEWWKFAKNNVEYTRSCMILLRMCVNSNVSKIRNETNEKCLLCGDIYEYESVHVVFECRKLEPVRQQNYSMVTRVMPQALVTEFTNRSNMEKMVIIASSLGGQVVEWNELKMELLKYIDLLCREAKKLAGNT